MGIACFIILIAMRDYTSTPDINHVVLVLNDCDKSCRNLTNFVARNLLFCDDEKFLQVVNNCAATCDLSVMLIQRKSPIIKEFLGLCEELSRSCAEVCSSHRYALSQLCAIACERASKVCAPLLNHERERNVLSSL